MVLRKLTLATEIRYKYVEHYEEALKTNHQGHSWKLSQMANDALTEDIKKIIRLDRLRRKSLRLITVRIINLGRIYKNEKTVHSTDS